MKRAISAISYPSYPSKPSYPSIPSYPSYPSYPPLPPSPPYFPSGDKLKDIFVERKPPRIGTVPFERRWRLGRIEELMDQKVAFKEPKLFKDQRRKRK